MTDRASAQDGADDAPQEQDVRVPLPTIHPAPAAGQEIQAEGSKRVQPTFCDGAELNIRKQKERNMPELNYTGIIETKDGKDEKTWTNLKSAQAAAGKLSKAGAKVTLFEVAKDGTERKLGVYVNGKMSKPKGKSGISPEEFCDLLGCREGTNRRTLASYLAKNMNQFVSAFDLHIALYGESNASSAGAMKMVMAGLLKMLEKQKLTKRFDVLMERRDGKTYYQLAEIG